jgi:hypothetical protein
MLESCSHAPKIEAAQPIGDCRFFVIGGGAWEVMGNGR